MGKQGTYAYSRKLRAHAYGCLDLRVCMRVNCAHALFVLLYFADMLQRVTLNTVHSLQGRERDIRNSQSLILWGRDSSVDITTRLRAGRSRNRISIPVGGKRCSLLYNVQTGCGAHPASYTVGTVGLFYRVTVEVLSS
jgi:hypothetical protein